jgi:hypothetical protein
MNEIVKKVLAKYLTNGVINIPNKFTRVKIDVGTSINAPHSENWLDGEDNLCVFAFEPNPFNNEFIKNGTEKIWPIHLDKKRINDTFFLIECALSNQDPSYLDFYCTDGDSGTSSLFEPNYFGVKKVVKVPTITLKDFFDLFPWEKIPFIEHLKIDAQSSDYNIIVGAGNYLKNNIMFLTIEITTKDQYKNINQPNENELKSYIESCGFECFQWGLNGNGSFYNKKFKDKLERINFVSLD